MGDIKKIKARTEFEQFVIVAKEVQKIIDAKIAKPEEIALIATKHDILKDAVKVLDYFKIPVSYEKGRNVLVADHIKQIISICKFIFTLANKGEQEADYFLPEILSYPFFGVSRSDLWQLSTIAYNYKEPSQKLWFSVLNDLAKNPNSENREAFENPELLIEIYNFLLSLRRESAYTPVEMLIDKITGVESVIFEGEDTDSEILDNSSDSSKKNWAYTFKSYRDYYFNPKVLDDALNSDFAKDGSQTKPDYLDKLSALKCFIDVLRNHKNGQVLYLKDFVELISLYEVNKMEIIDNSVYNSSENTVNLMTAHKSKGLEFKIVFVLSCVQNVWVKKPRSSKINLPQNLPLKSAREDLDDYLRLFYVALTRAEDKLYLCSYSKTENGSKVDEVAFLNEDLQEMIDEVEDYSDKEMDKVLDLWIDLRNQVTFSNIKEKQILSSTLDNYRMSVTHLQNFLDLSKGFDGSSSSFGPRGFLEQNLLRFPHAKIPSGSYGSAMHAAIAQFYTEFRASSRLPDLDSLLNSFQKYLKYQRLIEKKHFNSEFEVQKDKGGQFYEDFLEQGIDSLKLYYKDFLLNKADINTIIEKDFKHQGVQLGDTKRVFFDENGKQSFREVPINLTGKLDKMILDKSSGEVKVVDFKTGKPLKSFDKGDVNEKVKGWKYNLQLNFYRVLVERSREFQNYKALEGSLEFLDSGSKKNRYDKVLILEKRISDDDKARTEKLIQIVYSKIMKLDFPDTSNYIKNFKRPVDAIKQFEEDLLNGII